MLSILWIFTASSLGTAECIQYFKLFFPWQTSDISTQEVQAGRAFFRPKPDGFLVCYGCVRHIFQFRTSKQRKITANKHIYLIVLEKMSFPWVTPMQYMKIYFMITARPVILTGFVLNNFRTSSNSILLSVLCPLENRRGVQKWVWQDGFRLWSAKSAADVERAYIVLMGKRSNVIEILRRKTLRSMSINNW